MAIATIEDNRDYMLGKYEQMISTLRLLVRNGLYISSSEVTLIRQILEISGPPPSNAPDTPPPSNISDNPVEPL